MSKNYFITLILTFLLITACMRDICEDSCAGCLKLDQPFVANVNCENIYLDQDGKYFSIMFTDIQDNRTFGSACGAITGGTAKIFFETNIDGETSEMSVDYLGCANSLIPDVSAFVLPGIELNNFKFSILKVYPRSSTIQGPVELDKYDLLMQLSLK
jgi:hypothetical protein